MGWGAGAHPAAREAWRCCEALLGWAVPQAGLLPGARGPHGLFSHFHMMVADAALMSEGDNTWEVKITIAST